MIDFYLCERNETSLCMNFFHRWNTERLSHWSLIGYLLVLRFYFFWWILSYNLLTQVSHFFWTEVWFCKSHYRGDSKWQGGLVFAWLSYLQACDSSNRSDLIGSRDCCNANISHISWKRNQKRNGIKLFV